MDTITGAVDTSIRTTSAVADGRAPLCACRRRKAPTVLECTRPPGPSDRRPGKETATLSAWATGFIYIMSIRARRRIPRYQQRRLPGQLSVRVNVAQSRPGWTTNGLLDDQVGIGGTRWPRPSRERHRLSAKRIYEPKRRIPRYAWRGMRKQLSVRVDVAESRPG